VLKVSVVESRSERRLIKESLTAVRINLHAGSLNCPGYVREQIASNCPVSSDFRHDSVVLSNDLRARLEKFFRTWRQSFNPQFMSEPSIVTIVREQHRNFLETPGLPVKLSPVAKIRVGCAVSYAASSTIRRTGEWNAVGQTSGQQRRNCTSGLGRLSSETHAKRPERI
jgi:hypothetical protein